MGNVNFDLSILNWQFEDEKSNNLKTENRLCFLDFDNDLGGIYLTTNIDDLLTVHGRNPTAGNNVLMQ